jgi:hypothetical protein
LGTNLDLAPIGVRIGGARRRGLSYSLPGSVSPTAGKKMGNSPEKTCGYLPRVADRFFRWKSGGFGPLPAGHFWQKVFAVFATIFGRWEGGRRPLDFSRNSRPIFRQFFHEKKLKNSPLNLTVGGPLAGHAFFGQKLAKIFPEKGRTNRPVERPDSAAAFWGRISRKFGPTFDQNSESVSMSVVSVYSDAMIESRRASRSINS